MHRRVDGFVDRFLFRKRHLAEDHVCGVAGAMGFAHSEALVRAMLTKEPVRVFNLAGARIVSGLADPPDDLQTLASFLESKRSAVRLTDGQWNLCGAVFEEFMPAVAIPLLSHGTVDSIVLYGLHANGTAVDAEEIALLLADETGIYVNTAPGGVAFFNLTDVNGQLSGYLQAVLNDQSQKDGVSRKSTNVYGIIHGSRIVLYVGGSVSEEADTASSGDARLSATQASCSPSFSLEETVLKASAGALRDTITA